MEPLIASFILDHCPDNIVLEKALEIKSTYPEEKLGIVYLDNGLGCNIDLDIFDEIFVAKKGNYCFCFTEAELRCKTRNLIQRSSRIFYRISNSSFYATVIYMCKQRSIPCEAILWR